VAVVVDDGSTDGTGSVVADHMRRDPRIKYFRQENLRQAAAKNLGIENCSGQYIQFLDADDMIEPEKLSAQVEFLERHSEIDLVYGNVKYFRSYLSGRTNPFEWDDVGLWMKKIMGRGKTVLEPLVRNNIMPINAPLVRRPVIDSVGPFDVVLPPVEDWDYWLRCAALNKMFYYHAPEGTLSLVRWHPTSSSKNLLSMMRSTLVMRGKIPALTDDRELLAANREGQAYLEGWLGVDAADSGRLLEGVCRIVKASLMSGPMRWKLKWAACAVLAPFLSHARLRSFATSPINGGARRPCDD